MNNAGKIGLTAIIVGVIGWGTLHFKESRSIHQSDTISQSAPELGARAHKLLPNLDNAQVVVPDRPHDPMEVFSEDKANTITRTRQFSVSTNSMGFRDDAVTAKEGLRIVCIGDSVTFGWGVEQSESYPEQVQKILNVDVINTGVPALKPNHVEGYLNGFVDTLEPDIVLIAMRPNWMSPNPLQNYVQTMQRIQRKLQKNGIHFGLILPPLASFDPMGRSNNARELSLIQQQLRGIPLLDLTPIFDANLPNKGVYLRLDNGKQQMVERSSNTVLAEGIQPKPPQSLANEIVAYFENHTDVQEPLFFDGGHPDAEGFILFGESVASWLKDLEWVPSAH
jgi:lysophospholipase L1-like esterase